MEGKVAEEVWICNPIYFEILKIFRYPSYVHISREDRSKLDSKSKKCVFVGYAKGVKGFKLWNAIKKKTVISRDVVFYKQLMLKQSVATDVSASEEETFSKEVINVDVYTPPVNNL